MSNSNYQELMIGLCAITVLVITHFSCKTLAFAQDQAARMARLKTPTIKQGFLPRSLNIHDDDRLDRLSEQRVCFRTDPHDCLFTSPSVKASGFFGLNNIDPHTTTDEISARPVQWQTAPQELQHLMAATRE